MIFVGDDWAKDHHDVYVIGVRSAMMPTAARVVANAAAIAMGRPTVRTAVRPGLSRGGPDIQDRVNEVDATTRARACGRLLQAAAA